RTIFGDCAPLSQLPWFNHLQVFEPSAKPPCKAVFSFTEQEITTIQMGSQEDPLRIAVRTAIKRDSGHR
ncbi:hypothetical protein QUH40_29945, partial [Klebsiella pneumoniae]|nr:hypothetical protein [Klebsiella pneumoniae]